MRGEEPESLVVKNKLANRRDAIDLSDAQMEDGTNLNPCETPLLDYRVHSSSNWLFRRTLALTF